MTLKEGVKKKKTIRDLGIGKGGSYSNTIKRDIQDSTSGNKTTNWISEGGNQNYIAKRRYKTISFYVNWDYNIIVGETYV